jgi:DNA-directed RNA polymerase specialized sigma24 family protein
MPASAVRLLRVIAGDEGQSAADLLCRFIDRRDEAAFSLLMHRHAPMVWGVCRRILPTNQDAEDASQVTFLVLVEKARAVPRETVGNWLYGVARRAALLTRRALARRGERTGEMDEPDRWKRWTRRRRNSIAVARNSRRRTPMEPDGRI